MDKKINIAAYIRAEVIKNLLIAHERIAEKGNAKAIIILSKFLFRIAEQFDDKLFYFWLKESDACTKTPPQEGEE